MAVNIAGFTATVEAAAADAQAAAAAAAESAAAAEAAAADERKRLYERYRDDLSKREISNAENHDKSILTYSATGLGLSLGLLKDFIPMARADYGWALYGSWIFFVLSMIVVIISYPISQKVIRLQLDRAKRYYLEGDEDAFNESGKWDFCADNLNRWVSPTTFIIAIVLTIFFVSTNLKGATVAERKSPLSIAQEGLTGMQMQPVAEPKQTAPKGTAGVTVQPIQSNHPSVSMQQSQSQSKQDSNSSQTKLSR